ncbi:MAG: hypothetical protein QW264_08125, partial [Metallosphaera sp.]
VPLFASNPSKAVNNLTGREIDRDSGTPGYKDTLASIEKLSAEASPPLPKDNWRFHVQDRRRQLGIEVTKKWKREEFKPLID